MSSRLFQEIREKRGLVYSVYTGESGPDHEKCFEVAVLLNGTQIGTGSGTSKKRAEQNAARAAMEQLFPNKI